jgi:hypothetical protein
MNTNWNNPAAQQEEQERRTALHSQLTGIATEMHNHRMELQNKYTYFLLAVAGAAIAVTIRVTETSPIRWSQIPLGAAVGLWGASFYFGCQRINSIEQHTSANIEYVRHMATGVDGPVSPLLGGILVSMTDLWKQAKHNWDWQFRCLVCGAVMYVAWHVGEMIMRTVN